MSKVFLPVNWEIAADRSIVRPRFIGDGEVTNIAMSVEALEITLENRGAYPSYQATEIVDASTLKLVFERPEFIAFRSDHLQNVIYNIYVFQRDELDLAYALEWFTEKAMLDGLAGTPHTLFAVFQPITGGDAVIAAHDLRIYEARYGKWTVE